MPEFVPPGDTAEKLTLSRAEVGVRVDDPNRVALFEKQLSAHGLLDEHAETRHYASTLPEALNHHFTPWNRHVVHLLVTTGDPEHGLAQVYSGTLRYDQISADLAGEIFAPDAGMIAPSAGHLTHLGVDRIVEWQDRHEQPADIADGLRLHVQTVIAALERHEAEQAAEVSQMRAMRYLFGGESWQHIVNTCREQRVTEESLERDVASFLEIYPLNSPGYVRKRDDFADRWLNPGRGLDQSRPRAPRGAR